MTTTAAEAKSNAAPTPPADPRGAPRPRRPFHQAVFRLLGSLRLAVWLLILLALLTWLGTLAQVDRSTFDVQREYFESWFVIAKLPLSVWGRELFGGWQPSIPLPGAVPVLALLFVNILVGGLLRLKWNWRNAGVLTIHIGMLLLLVAGFIKLHYSYSGRMPLYEAPAEASQRLPHRAYESRQFVSFFDYELAITKDLGEQVEEWTVPASELRAAAAGQSVQVQGADLPFRVQVHGYQPFAKVLPKGPMFQAMTPVVDGMFIVRDEHPPGAQPRKEAEIAACYVTVETDDGQRLEAILQGLDYLPMDRFRYPFTFSVKDASGKAQRYGVDLRHVVADLPFALRLDKFNKSDHPGTEMARDFRSFVKVVGDGESRDVQIFMNNPMREAGYVVYQASWGPSVGGPPFFSSFEVSHNPSDQWPKYACFVIAAGLLVHFVMKLVRFLESSTRRSLLA